MSKIISDEETIQSLKDRDNPDITMADAMELNELTSEVEQRNTRGPGQEITCHRFLDFCEKCAYV